MTIHRVLCVDDEQAVLSGLERNLRKVCPVVTATSGARALEILRKDRAFSVIISDMRMPEMDGATFLTQARLLAPDAIRILLTGQADLDAVIAAVNGGNISRYLRKPVERDALVETVQRAFLEAEQYAAARERLESMARAALSLSLSWVRRADPHAAERAERVARLSLQLGEQLGLSLLPTLELAALAHALSHDDAGSRTAIDALFHDEHFAATRATLFELRLNAPAAQSAVSTRLIRAAFEVVDIEHALLEAPQKKSELERRVEPRFLEALQGISSRAAA